MIEQMRSVFSIEEHKSKFLLSEGVKALEIPQRIGFKIKENMFTLG